jgi:hypothetical protein
MIRGRLSALPSALTLTILPSFRAAWRFPERQYEGH